jgi:hypothetical protein
MCFYKITTTNCDNRNHWKWERSAPCIERLGKDCSRRTPYGKSAQIPCKTCNASRISQLLLQDRVSARTGAIQHTEARNKTQQSPRMTKFTDEVETDMTKSENTSKHAISMGVEVKRISQRMIQKLASEGPAHLIVLTTMTGQRTPCPVDPIMAVRMWEIYSAIDLKILPTTRKVHEEFKFMIYLII